MKFTEFPLHKKVLEAIEYMGFSEATPIQEKAIPLFLKKKDLIACAQTGTGKTAAFVIPLLDILSREKKNEGIQVLILVPTRELALQIDQQIEGFSYFLPIHSVPIYGGGDGQNWAHQKKALTMGAHIVVATPGKLISHLKMGYVDFDSVQHFILDEADRMLDMNFYDDIINIRKYLTGLKQTALFSATMAPKIEKLANNILHTPEIIKLEISKPAEGISQEAYWVEEKHKIELVQKIVQTNNKLESILIFTATKKKVAEIVKSLHLKSVEAKGISSLLNQTERENIMLLFKAKKIKVLVATDVLSRGIDINDIDLVINFEVPDKTEEYVHRVGRTARSQKTGTAITLIAKADRLKLRNIENTLGINMDKIRFPIEY